MWSLQSPVKTAQLNSPDFAELPLMISTILETQSSGWRTARGPKRPKDSAQDIEFCCMEELESIFHWEIFQPSHRLQFESYTPLDIDEDELPLASVDSVPLLDSHESLG
ncbi:uncharacterized protein EDB91DRAFT_1090309 [Suillus paluster]|uniref:uncharacterized protein n=1 Tax=Suillus paluster TaxID=48578 RepID=UPI001B877FE5|nr:uncharacterized protein EDB91DRAFT_1090309 [Suillus paluster]KAG1718112.1 hypothetical protein EDB91DRAFT_1090309 [Suillus paluster]